MRDNQEEIEESEIPLLEGMGGNARSYGNSSIVPSFRIFIMVCELRLVLSQH